jgi:hypothetical protein
MQLHEDDLGRIASRFVEARRTAAALDAFPGTLPATLSEAYRVQESAIALGGRAIAGWKVAGIRPDLRETLGANRLAGPIMAGTVHHLPNGGARWRRCSRGALPHWKPSSWRSSAAICCRSTEPSR